MAVRVKTIIRGKLEEIEIKKKMEFQSFKELVEVQTKRVGLQYKEMIKGFEKYFEQMDQVLRKCLEVERAWKRRIVSGVTDVYGHKVSEDFKMEFSHILEVLWITCFCMQLVCCSKTTILIFDTIYVSFF